MRADIVDTRGEQYANGYTKTPLDRLGPCLDRKKSLLLVSIAAIRAVPVTVVRKIPATPTDHTPVSNLMEGTSYVVGPEINTMW